MTQETKKTDPSRRVVGQPTIAELRLRVAYRREQAAARSTPRGAAVKDGAKTTA